MILNAVKVIPVCGREIHLVGQETSLPDVAPRAHGRSSGVGFEADGAEVVTGGEADVGVQSGRQMPEQRNSGLGFTLLDALDLVGVMAARRATSAIARPRAVRRS